MAVNRYVQQVRGKTWSIQLSHRGIELGGASRNGSWPDSSNQRRPKFRGLWWTRAR